MFTNQEAEYLLNLEKVLVNPSNYWFKNKRIELN
jgi:hypothetical protein